MIRRRRYLLFAAAVTGLLLVAPTAQAAVDQCWTYRPPCATGAITSYSVEPSDDGDDIIIHLGGWSAQCAPRDPRLSPPAQFGLILYADTGGWLARLTTYVSPTAPKEFSYRVNYMVERPRGPVVAACLAYDYVERLSCVAVDLAQNLAVVNPPVVPISVQDDRVTSVIFAPCAQCVPEPPTGTRGVA
jgi:hypothetical protein